MSQRPHSKAVARAGEHDAVAFLEHLGYRVAQTNVRPLPGLARGEIDIVAWEGAVLCFVEVKTRRSPHSRPWESITPAKQRQLTLLAEAYLSLHNIDNTECRFDVVSIVAAGDHPKPQITLMRNAFSASERFE